MAQASYKDYQKRKIRSPLLLIHHNMSNQHTRTKRMDALSRNRLREIRAYITPGGIKTSLDRLNMFMTEHNYLTQERDLSSLLRLHKRTAPLVTKTVKRFPSNPEILNSAAWNYSNHGTAHANAGQWKSALHWADRLLHLLGKPVKDREIRQSRQDSV